MGAHVTVARDVKLLAYFDPARLRGFRLIGYENRGLANREGACDAVDAGELGARG